MKHIDIYLIGGNSIGYNMDDETADKISKWIKGEYPDRLHDNSSITVEFTHFVKREITLYRNGISAIDIAQEA